MRPTQSGLVCQRCVRVSVCADATCNSIGIQEAIDLLRRQMAQAQRVGPKTMAEPIPPPPPTVDLALSCWPLPYAASSSLLLFRGLLTLLRPPTATPPPPPPLLLLTSCATTFFRMATRHKTEKSIGRQEADGNAYKCRDRLAVAGTSGWFGWLPLPPSVLFSPCLCVRVCQKAYTNCSSERGRGKEGVREVANDTQGA